MGIGTGAGIATGIGITEEHRALALSVRGWLSRAAAVVVSERFAERHGLGERAVEIAAQAVTTDTEASFASGSCIDAVGAPMPRPGARAPMPDPDPGSRPIPDVRAARRLGP